MQWLRDLGKKVLPLSVIERYRRRRQVRAYLKALGYELHERQTRLDQEDIEDRIAARHDGFYQRAVKEVLDRTELVLQALDRRIEGVAARHGNDLRELKDQVAELRASVDGLRDRPDVADPTPPPERASSVTTPD